MTVARRRFLLIIAVLAFHASNANAQQDDWNGRGDEIVRRVREQFYDPKAAAIWADRHVGYANDLSNAGQFTERTRAILAELKASHTAYYTDRDVRYYGLRSIFAGYSEDPAPEYSSIGVDLTQEGFIQTVFAGAPGDKAGLRRGDRILKADGKPFEPVESFRGRARQIVELTVQRKAEDEPILIPVRPHLIDAKKEWLDAQIRGTRIIRKGDKNIAYVSMFSCAGDDFQESLRQMIPQRLTSADALIIDFRNGWGGCNPSFVNLFNRAPSVNTHITRAGQRGTLDYQWRKPLFILINGGSKSGKEVVAHSIKKHRLGTLVGERTGGAVLGGRMFPLSDNSLLYLAVTSVEVDGERLEGRGVEPDVKVSDSLPFANGADPQLEKSLELAAR